MLSDKDEANSDSFKLIIPKNFIDVSPFVMSSDTIMWKISITCLLECHITGDLMVACMRYVRDAPASLCVYFGFYFFVSRSDFSCFSP